LKAGKVVVGLLDTEQAALPRAKTENHDCKENKRHPSGGGLRPAGKMGDGENRSGRKDADYGANQRCVDDVSLHERLDPMEMFMMVQLRVMRGQHVDLGSGNAGALQLLFYGVQVIQVVAYEIAP